MVVAILALGCSSLFAAETDVHPERDTGICLESLTAGISWACPSEGDATYTLYDHICFASDKIAGKLTVEYWSDGYDRYTLYLGSAECRSTTAAVRWDDMDRLWVGFNHAEKITNELTFVVRPLVGANSATEDRLYLIADYSAGGKIGAMAFFAGIDDNGKTEDLYLGPTFRNGRASYWLAANVSNSGIYADISYTIPLK